MAAPPAVALAAAPPAVALVAAPPAVARALETAGAKAVDRAVAARLQGAADVAAADVAVVDAAIAVE